MSDRRTLLLASGQSAVTDPINTDNYLTILALEDGLTVSLSVNACQYCVNGNGKWMNLPAGTTTQTISQGQTLSFKGNLTPNSSNGIGTFTISKKCNLEGNCMSMLFGDDVTNNYSLSGRSWAFNYLFEDCTTIIEVSDTFLPATTLADYCYSNMFFKCTSLTTAPVLPATTLASWCYYRMFYKCTSLTTAPVLPATTLVSWCYSYMFYNCSKLNYIKMLATDISASYCLSYWVYSVSSTGTFVKKPYMTSLPTGTNGIPSGWTVVDDTGGSNLITFKVNSIEYQAEEGMTWEEFVNSEYNVDGFFCDSNKVYIKTYLFLNNETPSDVIGNGVMYSANYSGGGAD